MIMSSLEYNREGFLLNGEPFRIVSGAMHYFRIVPGYWEDRLLKLKQCGFNTVETVTCWNLHERKEGVFDFSGILDLEKYIETAKKLGLYVILRPGPYICAEFDMGGLPSWLMQVPGMQLRCDNDAFIEKVERYLAVLFEKVRPHLIEHGGNVIAMQIENEYGSFGDDKAYLRRVEEIYEKQGMECLLFTSDGPGYFMLSGGTIEGRLATVNFGSNPKDNFALLKKFRPDQPAMCMEYWNGWFDHWYEEHHQRESGEAAEVFKEMLQGGHSVNFYMFHGGTNFGLHNGANFGEHIEPTITSYDYNAPLSESGDLTDKYMAVHDVMEEVLGEKLPITVGNTPKKSYGKVQMTEHVDLLSHLEVFGTPIDSVEPMTFEELGLDFGYVLYESVWDGPIGDMDFEIDGLADRAIIYIDGKFAGIKESTGKRWDPVRLSADFGEHRKVQILVENMGRVNYGGHITDAKGITKGVRIANRYHYHWKNYPIRMEDVDKCEIGKLTVSEKEEKKKALDGYRPTFYRGILLIEECADTFIETTGFEKGIVWMNGFCLGRYYNSAGPQKTLYVPAPILKHGENEILIFETDACKAPEIAFLDCDNLG